VLPSDFAAQLGYVLANGTEDYLPAYISMRYASYQTPNGLTLNAVYVTTPFVPGNPPVIITVSGITYLLKSSYGEVRGFTPNPNILVIAGPQGPPGGGGGGGVTSVTAGTGISVSPTSGNVVVTNTGLVSFQPTFLSSALTLNNTATIGANHGLGRNPYMIRGYFQCITGDAGYAVGDQIDVLSALNISSNMYGGQLGCNATQVFFVYGLGVLQVPNKTSWVANGINNASWHLFLAAW